MHNAQVYLFMEMGKELFFLFKYNNQNFSENKEENMAQLSSKTM